MIDQQLVEEWEFMLRESTQTIDAVLGEMRTVLKAEKRNRGPQRPKPQPVQLPPVKIEARTTYYERGGDRQALLRQLKHTIDGDPVHGGGQVPVKIVRQNGVEVLVWTMEEVYSVFGVEG